MNRDELILLLNTLRDRLFELSGVFYANGAVVDNTVHIELIDQQILKLNVELGATFPWNQLTTRELQMAKALIAGMSTAEAAAAMQISSKTGDTHRGHVLKKLGVKSNADLVRLAITTGVYR